MVVRNSMRQENPLKKLKGENEKKQKKNRRRKKQPRLLEISEYWKEEDKEEGEID